MTTMCQVQVVGYPAYVRYIGQTHFAPGEWVGVELEPGKWTNVVKMIYGVG